MKPRATTSGLGGAGGYSLLNPYTPKTTGAPKTPPPGANDPGVNYGATNPDWKTLIENDSGLQSLKSLVNAGQGADLAGRNADIRRALVMFGNVPDIKSLAAQLGMSEEDVSAALGPDIQKLAQEATDSGVSTEARLKATNDDSLRALKADLNRRGILNSGEAGFQLDHAATGYQNAEFDARNKVLDFVRQYQQGYLQGQQQRNSQVAQGYSEAATRQYNTNESTPAGHAAYDHTDDQGVHVYKGENGQFYTVDANGKTVAYAPAAPAAPPAPEAPNAPYITPQPALAPRVGRNVMA